MPRHLKTIHRDQKIASECCAGGIGMTHSGAVWGRSQVSEYTVSVIIRLKVELLRFRNFEMYIVSAVIRSYRE